MTAQTQDASAALDVMEEIVALERAEPDVLLSELATLLLGLQGDSPYRPRVHRLMGVVQMRLKRGDDALRELAEAKALAEAQSQPDALELAKIGRETAAIQAAQGAAEPAAETLRTSLALAALENDAGEIARIVSVMGGLERDAQRFATVVQLYQGLVSKGAVSMLPPHEARAVRAELCHALNRLARHEDALREAAALREALPEGDDGGLFLARLEEARALSGLGRHDDAERALVDAQALLPERDGAREHSAFIQAVTELQEAKGGPAAVESLAQLAANAVSDGEMAQAVVIGRALADAWFARGEGARAREALAVALRTAVRHGFDEAAEALRADLNKQGAEQVEDLATTIDLIGGGGEAARVMRLRRLGAGPGGAVWLAVDLTDGELVALRTVDLEGADDTHREAALAAYKTVFVPAARADDPRLVKTLSLRLAPGRALYVMQRYVEGASLRSLYGQGSSPARLLILLAGVADGLAVLHGQGLAHRDLKPETVIVTSGHGMEWPVLIGLGVPLPGQTDGTFASPATPPYTAPEQVAGEPGEAAADVYALGQMIAEVWGGKVPSRQGLGRLWQRQTADGMPRGIQEIVTDMLLPDPDKRAVDLSSVAEVLRRQSEEMAAAAAP